jgi:hypothetical protein
MVQFAIDGSNIGNPVEVTTTAGVTTASFTTGFFIGAHTVSASYQGDANFSSSNGGLAGGQTVKQASTSTLLVSTPNPSQSGQTVTFTATVNVQGPGSTNVASPTGIVTFFDGSSKIGQGTLSTTSGATSASFSTSTLTVSTHTITASYSGDGSFVGGTSAALTQTVGKATTASTTTTVTSSANPQTQGQPVNWTATVAADGAVNFVNFESGDFSQAATYTGGAIVTSPALDGTYSLQLTRSNSVANYEIRQSGTSYYNLPTAYYSLLFEYTSNPSEGSIVNFQDTGSGFKAALHLSPAGVLLFYDNSGTLLATGTTTLTSGQVDTISAKIGTGSNAPWEVRINDTVEMSGTGNLGSNNNGSVELGGNGTYTTNYYYDDVAINSQSYPGPVPTGTVQFAIDGTAFGGPVTLSGGSATSGSTSSLSAGSHTITATYYGDSSYTASTGSYSETIGSQSIAEGTILIASSPLSGQPTAATGIIGVSPSTGAQSLIATGGSFSLPETVREGPNQELYVADYYASQTGAIIQVDPATGKQSVLAGGNINGPDALAIINGFLYVADTGGVSGAVPNLVEINQSTGQQRLVSSGGNFSTPVGLAAAPNNSLYCADETALGGAGAIFVVNLQTGAQTVLSQGGLLDHVLDIGLDTSGNLIVINAGSGSGGSIVRVNPQSGAQTLVSSSSLLTSLDGGTVDVNHGGTILVSALASGDQASRILAIDPATGVAHVVASGGILSLVAGLAVFSSSGGQAAAMPPHPAFSGQHESCMTSVNSATPVLWSADLSVSGSIVSLFQSMQSQLEPIERSTKFARLRNVFSKPDVPTAVVDLLFADQYLMNRVGTMASYV